MNTPPRRLFSILHGFLHGDTETTTDRGQLWLGAIMVCNRNLLCMYIHTPGNFTAQVRIYTSFPRPKFEVGGFMMDDYDDDDDGDD